MENHDVGVKPDFEKHGIVRLAMSGDPKQDGIAIAACPGATYEEIGSAIGMDPRHVRAALCPMRPEALPAAAIKKLGAALMFVWGGMGPLFAAVAQDVKKRGPDKAFALDTDDVIESSVEGGLSAMGPELAPVISAAAAGALCAFAAALEADVCPRRGVHGRNELLVDNFGVLYSAGQKPAVAGVNATVLSVPPDRAEEAREGFEILDVIGWDGEVPEDEESAAVLRTIDWAVCENIVKIATCAARAELLESDVETLDDGTAARRLAGCPSLFMAAALDILRLAGPEDVDDAEGAVKAWDKISGSLALRNKITCAMAVLEKAALFVAADAGEEGGEAA